MTELSDLFMITSVIKTGGVPWHYACRSVYTYEERFQQTLNTIKSIRERRDNVRILLVEGSNINAEMERALRDNVDFYINCYNNIEARYACLESEKKGFGEAVKSKIAMEYIIDNHITFNRLFKLSGRYWLNSSFDKNKYSEEKYTFNNKFLGLTVIYSVPYNLRNDYLSILKRCCDVYKMRIISYEELLPPMCNPKHLTDGLGVSGYVAVTPNEYFSA
jgi:hypothetical protein